MGEKKTGREKGGEEKRREKKRSRRMNREKRRQEESAREEKMLMSQITIMTARNALVCHCQHLRSASASATTV